MRCNSLSDAHIQAKTNADMSGDTWVVIRDTNGQYHAESSKVTSPDLEIVISAYVPVRKQEEH